MKTLQSRRLLGKTVGIVIPLATFGIAAASLLVSIPTHAKPSSTSQVPAGTQAAPTQATGTIVDIASASPNLKTLVAALKAAGLVEIVTLPPMPSVAKVAALISVPEVCLVSQQVPN